jgi:hypothetical protein
VWEQFRHDMPWLLASDAAHVAMACRLKALFDRRGQMTAAELNLLRLLLSSMGGNPADRSKVKTPDAGDEARDPADDYLN